MPEELRYLDRDVSGGLGDGTSWANAYTSRAAWSTAEGKNLISAGNTHRLIFRASSGTIDSSSVPNMPSDGWVTDATHFVTIEPESGQESRKDAFDNSVYRCRDDFGNSFVLSDYTVLKGMQFVNTAYKASGVINISSVGILIDSIRMENAGSSSAIQSTNALSTSKIQNSIIVHDGVSTGGSEGIYCQTGTIESINNTVDGFDDNYERDAGIMSCTNDISINAVSQDFDGTITKNYCIANVATGSNPQTPSGANWDNEVVDHTNGDFTSIAMGNIQYGIGPSVDSNVPVLDIEGDTRSGATAFIGVDEPAGTSQEVIIEPVINEPENITAQLLLAKRISATVNEPENITAALLSGKAIIATITDSESIEASLLTAKIITAIVNEPETITATLLTESTTQEVIITPVVNESESITCLLLLAKEIKPIVNEYETITAVLKNRLPLFPVANESETVTALLLIDGISINIDTITTTGIITRKLSTLGTIERKLSTSGIITRELQTIGTIQRILNTSGDLQ